VKRLLPVLLALVGCIPAPTPAEPPPAPSRTFTAGPVAVAAAPPWGSEDQLGAYLDDFVGAIGRKWGEPYAFSGVVAAAKDGKPILVRAYGKANRETGAIADADTRFPIGSLTKQFTAVCILQLAEQGKLKVEDTIRTYLPDYPKQTGDKITLHQLLSHTSGLPNYTADEALMKASDKDHSPAEVLATFEDKPLHFDPGTRWEYSNSNFFLLGLVIEKVSGHSYEQYLQAHLLGPAGMTRTSTIDAPDTPDTATGYATDPEGNETLVRAKVDSVTVEFAAGALRSTVNDLFRWDRALSGTLLLSAASKARMLTPVREEYGYGIGVRVVGGHVMLLHNGGVSGFRSALYRVPDAGLTVVTLVNGLAAPEPVADAMLSMVLEGRRLPPVEDRDIAPTTPELVARVTGDYVMSAASKKELEGKLPTKVMDGIARIHVGADGTQLSFKPNGQGKLRVYSDGGDVLFTKQAGIELVLEGEAKDPVKAFVLKQGPLAGRYERAIADQPAVRRAR
jgi:CubicO group peptidase (beta-lactamase class C family)